MSIFFLVPGYETRRLRLVPRRTPILCFVFGGTWRPSSPATWIPNTVIHKKTIPIQNDKNYLSPLRPSIDSRIATTTSIPLSTPSSSVDQSFCRSSGDRHRKSMLAGYVWRWLLHGQNLRSKFCCQWMVKKDALCQRYWGTERKGTEKRLGREQTYYGILTHIFSPVDMIGLWHARRSENPRKQRRGTPRGCRRHEVFELETCAISAKETRRRRTEALARSA